MLYCVGKLRESGARLLADEYLKRLTRYITFDIIEIPDQPEPRRLTESEIARTLDAEGAAILRRIKPTDLLIACAETGGRATSEEFAAMFARHIEQSPRLCFAIGGSLGLSGAVLDRADARLSLSDMTFPHALARVILLEQIYRACKINANERYHK
jgi:23S rRNA (pseudouridine1915-N3)-methyltransferase